MGANALSTALAPTFAWTSTGTDLVLSFPSGSPASVTVNLATGAYRMQLAPSIPPVTDALRAAQTAINNAVATAGRSEVFALALGAAGKLTLSCTGGAGSFSAALGPLLKLLGWTGAISTGASATAACGPKYLALFYARLGGDDWIEATPEASAETAGGVGYGVTSGVTTWTLDAELGPIPRDPTTAATFGDTATPWYPNDGDLPTRAAHDAPWGVTDVLAATLGATVAVADGNFQDLLTSTTETYSLVTIPGKDRQKPRHRMFTPGLLAYRVWAVGLLRQASAPTGTRA